MTYNKGRERNFTNTRIHVHESGRKQSSKIEKYICLPNQL